MSEFDFESLITNRLNDNTFYNFSDLNRVEAATEALAEILTAAGYFTTVSVKKDWNRKDKPTETEMKRYLENVKLCTRQFGAATGITLPVSINDLTYIGANNIEKTIAEMNKLINYMTQVLRKSGTFYSGSMDGLRGYCL